MNINLGNYVITSDEYQFILHERKVYGDKSKNVGDEYLTVVGYYPTWRGLAEKLIHLQLNNDDSDTFKGVVDNLERYLEHLVNHLKHVEKALENTTSS